MKTLIYICLFFTLSLHAQNNGNNEDFLIVIHPEGDPGPDMKQSIYSYKFINNVYAGREKLLTVTGKKDGKDYIRLDGGENTIYKNRYLISGIGNIIDLKEKKVLHDGSARLVYCANDSIVFYTNDIFKGKFYSYFDLKTNTYSEIKNLTFKPIPGQDVEFDRTKSPYKLLYYPPNKPKVVLMEDAGHGGVSTTHKLGGIPIYWLDNDIFIFPNIKVSNLEGALVKYNLQTRSAKEIGTFNSSSSLSSNFKFIKTKTPLVEFYFKDKLYLINPAKETMLPTNYKECDAGFSIELSPKPTGRGVWFKGKEIGRNHFEPKNFKSCANYAAIVKELVMGDESYQQGLGVYNAVTNKWENVDAEDVLSLVGWIK